MKLNDLIIIWSLLEYLTLTLTLVKNPVLRFLHRDSSCWLREGHSITVSTILGNHSVFYQRNHIPHQSMRQYTLHYHLFHNTQRHQSDSIQTKKTFTVVVVMWDTCNGLYSHSAGSRINSEDLIEVGEIPCDETDRQIMQESLYSFISIRSQQWVVSVMGHSKTFAFFVVWWCFLLTSLFP